jgi:hypothetical protein
MGQHLDLAKKRLFDKDALGVTNIKLFPGSSRDTTPEQFAEEINKALSQLEAGEYSELKIEELDAK